MTDADYLHENPPVLVADRGRVRTLTLNRPDALNAFNDDQYDAASAALNAAAGDDGIAVVIITGAGRAFCAGQDLAEMAAPRRHSDGKPHGFPHFIDTVTAFPKPLIAAVNGLGVGIGLTLLPHCDLVLMSAEARLRAPFATLGVTVEAANSYLLPQLVGWANAAHLLYTAEWLSAAQCVAMGLVWKQTPPAELLAETTRLAEQIAAMPIASLVHTKKLLLASRNEAVQAARARETDAFRDLLGGPANREALQAFKDKRPPDFTRLDTAG